MWSVLVGIAVGVAGCYAPLAPDGVPCSDGSRCPTGQHCVSLTGGDKCFANDPDAPDAPIGNGDGPVPGDGQQPLACVPRRLLTGGTDVAQQGWAIERVGTGTVTYQPGVTILATSGNARQLLTLHDVFPSDRWQLDFVVEVTASGGHLANHAAIALMASFHGPVGDDADRKRMLYLDETAAGWGDGAVALGMDTKRVVTYRIERVVSSNGGLGIKTSAIVDGASQFSLSSSPFTSNGAIAIGDQTTEPGLDSTIRVVSVDLACP